ncbi:MAG: lytic transglycosylase domain-containing protein [Spirochaetes bacterium]|nr:lytic transglycosylase domain-containing protein [Spirochaetota bacterium]
MKKIQVSKTYLFKIIFLFILFFFCFSSCARAQITPDFYRGLNKTKTNEAVRLFENALASPNVYIRRAAAEELAKLESSAVELSSKTLRRIRSEISGWRAAAYVLFENGGAGDNILDFFLNFDYGETIPNEAKVYILQECKRRKIFLNEKEEAAIEGHYAVSRQQYNEALVFFRVFQEDGNWPLNIPEIFIKYPVLINDLGKAFQYTSYGTEGLSLFIKWLNNIDHENPDQKNILYNLQFYAARIARRNGRNTQAASFFEQAILYAPNTEQSDACIWYILELSLGGTTEFFTQQLGKFVSGWHDGCYFNDILERFLHVLVSKKEWKRIIQIFDIIKDSGASMKSGYAWVIVRLVEEGFLSKEDLSLRGAKTGEDISVFLQIAYNTPYGDLSPTLYYRSLIADALNLPFLEFHEETAEAKRKNYSPAMQFLLGFFTHKAAEHVLTFIKQMERELSVDELRIIAQSLEKEEMYVQSMLLVSRYITREGYVLDRRDLELLFPCPYRELVEKHAKEIGIEAYVVFGLIRTESAFQKDVISRAGAVGLTQLMPATAQEMAGRIRRAGGPDYAAVKNGIDLNDPETNIHIGAYYLNYLMGRFEDTLLSLMAYNGGMNRLRRLRSASSLPVDLFLETIAISETRDYGRKVLSAAAVYKMLYY